MRTAARPAVSLLGTGRSACRRGRGEPPKKAIAATAGRRINVQSQAWQHALRAAARQLAARGCSEPAAHLGLAVAVAALLQFVRARGGSYLSVGRLWPVGMAARPYGRQISAG